MGSGPKRERPVQPYLPTMKKPERIEDAKTHSFQKFMEIQARYRPKYRLQRVFLYQLEKDLANRKPD